MNDRSGSPWTPEDVAQLRRLAEGGLTAAAIAARMGRSREAIIKKAVAERLSLDPAKHQSR